ncbi:sugar ABC transporter substrate-binding protein, partial [Thioclava sp. BHET1]
GKKGRVQVCGINIDKTVLENIKNGGQLCAVDQQGYMMGYLAVSILNANVNYGMTIPTKKILTGPAIIDKANVDVTLKGVNAGVR